MIPQYTVLKFCLIVILANLAWAINVQAERLILIDDPTDCDLVVSVNPDAHICDPDDFELEGDISGDFDSFVWCENGSPTSYDITETVELTAPTTFTLKAFFLSEENGIENGDFESGDSGFSTDYVQGSSNCVHGAGFLGCEGTYEVMDNPSDGHTNFDPCSDNGGGGNMMVVNGAASLQQIWCQTVCVEAGKDYVFSANATSVNPGSPAILQFSIDGDLIGSEFGLSGSTCDWEYFEELWVSSGQTSVEICVTNQNTAAGGNDFALDDIGFFQVCEEEASFDVTFSNFNVIIDQPFDLDCNNEEVEINIEVEPFEVYDILWDTGDGDIVETLLDGYSILVNSPGTYYVTVTDMMGCEREEEVTVYQDVILPELDITKSGDLDCDNIEVEIIVDSNLNGLEYIWTDSDGNFVSSDDDFYVYVGGTYFLTAIDNDTGCEKMGEITVIEDTSAPDFDILSTNDLTCGQDFTLIYTDNPFETVNWVALNQNLTFPTEDTLIISVPGSYEATVINQNGCFHVDTVDVEEILPNFDYQFSFDANINCSNPGSIVNLTYNTDLFDIDWLGLPDVYNDSISFTLFDDGKYLFTLTDTLGCIKSDSLQISGDFAQPNVIANTTEIDCNTPFATLSISDPNNEFEVEWIDASGNVYDGDQVEISQGGPVDYIITARNGCTNSNSIMVEASDEFPVLSISGGDISCSQTEVTLEAGSNQNNVTFTWELPDGTTQAGVDLTTNESGNYTVFGENQDGCISSAVYNVLADIDEPEFELEALIQLDCNNPVYNGVLTFQEVPQDYVYNGNWFNPSDQSIIIDEAGSYDITLIGENGCTKTKTLTVEIDDVVPDFEILDPGILDCNNPELTLMAELGTDVESVLWSGSNSTSEEESILINQGGDYSLNVIGENGCSDEKLISIGEDFAEPEINISATEINCAEKTAFITVSSDLELVKIEYFNQSTLIGQGDLLETEILSPIEIIITAENGCTNSDVITVIENVNSIVFDAEVGQLDCNEIPVTIGIFQSFDVISSILYDDQGIAIGDVDTEISVAGNFTIELTLNDGCLATSSFEVLKDESTIEFDLNADEINCDLTPVFIQIETSENYISSQVFDSTNQLLGDIDSEITIPGIYNVVLKGDNGCTSSKSIEVFMVDDAPEIASYEIEELVCSEAVNITEVYIQGGMPPYVIELDGQVINASLEAILVEGAGSHSIEVTDALGCQIETSFDIDPVIPLTTNIDPEIILKLGESKVLELTVNKAPEEIESILWTPSEGLSCDDCMNPTVQIEESQTYSVTVIDKNGCEETTEIRVAIQRTIKYYVPNIMISQSTGDGNGNFTIYTKDNDIEEIVSLDIYDRWGNKVFLNNNFLPNDPGQGWDGTFNNRNVNHGVYVYKALLKLRNGTEELIAGDLTILK